MTSVHWTTATLIAFFIPLHCASVGASAQVTPADALPLPEAASAFPAESMMEIVRPYLRATLTSTERTKFDQIRISFPNDLDFTRVMASQDDAGRPVVEISQGYLLLANALIFAARVDMDLNPRKTFTSYLAFIRTNLPSDMAIAQETGISPLYQPFHRWAGISDEAAERIRKKHQDQILQTSVDAFVFTVAHEVAHHMLGHGSPKNNRQSRDQEFAADKWAVSVSHKMKRKTDGLLPVLLFLALIEGDVDDFDASDHDPAICRYAQLAEGPFKAEGESLRTEIFKRCERPAHEPQKP